MAVRWPPELPELTPIQGYQETIIPNRVITKPLAGPGRRRRRFTRERRAFQRAIVVDPTEYQVFLDFYNDVLGGGTQPFEAPHPVTGKLVTYAFAEENVRIRAIGFIHFEIQMTLEEQ